MNDKTDLVVSLSFKICRTPHELVRSYCASAAAMETPTFAMMHSVHKIGRL